MQTFEPIFMLSGVLQLRYTTHKRSTTCQVCDGKLHSYCPSSSICCLKVTFLKSKPKSHVVYLPSIYLVPGIYYGLYTINTNDIFYKVHPPHLFNLYT